MRIRKTAQRLCFASAAILFLMSVALPTGSGTAATAPPVDESKRPTVFAGVAGADGVHQDTNGRNGLAVIAEPVYTGAPDALTKWGSDTALSRASTYYPGIGLSGLVLLGCGHALEGFPPPFSSVCNSTTESYPLTADAPDPNTGSPDASTATSQDVGGGGAPVGLTASSATAHAARDYVSGQAVDSDYRMAGTTSQSVAVLSFRRQVALLLHGPAAAAAVQPRASDSDAAHAQSSQATAKQVFDTKDPSLLIVTADAVVKGLSLFGGQVHIDSVTTHSETRTNGIAKPTHVDTVTVDGVTAAGQPAVIDQDGVHLVGTEQGKPLIDQMNTALQQALAASNTTIRLIAPSQPQTKGGTPPALNSSAFDTKCGQGEADGVQFYQQVDAQSVPNGDFYTTNMTIGSACTDAYASAERGVAPSGGGATAEVSTNVGGTVVGASEPSVGGGETAPAIASGNGTAASTPLAAPSTGPRGATGGTTTLANTSAAKPLRLSLVPLYLAFTLAFLGLVLGSRSLLPARLPRNH